MFGFGWLNKKKREAAKIAKHEDELKRKLAEKMKDWSPDAAPTRAVFTDYTMVDGEMVKTDRVNLGDTEPDLELADSTDFNHLEYQERLQTEEVDPWASADPSDTGRWKRNLGK